MNKIFKVIWNPATGNYTVTSETAKSRGKKSGRSKLLISALVAGGMLSSFGALANAGNDNGQGVDYGSGSAGDGWVAIGKGAKANTFMNTSGSSTAVGYDAIAEGQYSSAIGSKTHAIGGASMAFGVSAISEGDRSIALGASSYSLGQYSMAPTVIQKHWVNCLLLWGTLPKRKEQTPLPWEMPLKLLRL